MMGGAVSALSHEAGAVWYNPAGLGANSRGRLQLSNFAGVVRIRSIDAGLVTLGSDQRQEEDLNATEATFVAPAFTSAIRLRPGLSAGFGFFVTAFDSMLLRSGSNQTGTDNDRLLTRLEADFSVTRYHTGPAIGWQVHPRLRIGLSLLGIYETETNRGLVGLDVESEARALRANLFLQAIDNPTRVGLESVLGLQWEALDRLHLALVFRSPRLLVHESIDQTNFLSINGSVPGQVEATNIFQFDLSPRRPMSFGFYSPLRLTGGMALALGKTWWTFEGDFSPGFDKSSGNIDYQPTWNLRSGIKFPVDERLSLGVGLFTDRNPLGVQRDFPRIRTDYYGLSLGGRYDTVVRLAEGQGPSNLVFSFTAGLRYALGVGKFTQFTFDLRPDAPNLFRTDTSSDVYFHDISAYLGSELLF